MIFSKSQTTEAVDRTKRRQRTQKTIIAVLESFFGHCKYMANIPEQSPVPENNWISLARVTKVKADINILPQRNHSTHRQMKDTSLKKSKSMMKMVLGLEKDRRSQQRRGPRGKTDVLEYQQWSASPLNTQITAEYFNWNFPRPLIITKPSLICKFYVLGILCTS